MQRGTTILIGQGDVKTNFVGQELKNVLHKGLQFLFGCLQIEGQSDQEVPAFLACLVKVTHVDLPCDKCLGKLQSIYSESSFNGHGLVDRFQLFQSQVGQA